MEAPRVEEPPTAGRVVLKTSVGDLQVDLWSQQAPLACRNFVQLCMERYYEDVIFHRIVKKFMAQTGDPTGTGAGGASIFEDGKAFKDEIHQRLVFSRAGLLAMASKDEKRNSNQSQFFVTLGPCEWLNKQHTIFGKVTGDSIYNLHKFEAVEVDANGRPVAPEPRILSATVVDQPFPDIKPRKSRQEIEASKLRKQARKEEKRKKMARKHLDKKDTRLVSFGADEDEEDADDGSDIPAALSLHNRALQPSRDPRTSEESAAKDAEEPKAKESKDIENQSAKESQELPRVDVDESEIVEKAKGADKKESRKERKRSKKEKKSKKDGKRERSRKRSRRSDDERNKSDESDDSREEKEKRRRKEKDRKLDKEGKKSKRVSDAQPKDEYESLRQELRGTSNDAQGKSTSASASMSAFEQRRAKYLQRRPAGAASQKSHQRNTLAKLQEFQAKLAKAGANANGKTSSASNTNDTLKEEENYKGGIGENQMEDEGVQDANGHEWMHTELRFKRHIDDAFRSDKRGEKSHGRTDEHGKGRGTHTDDENDDADELTIIDAKTAMGRAAFDQLEDERNRGPPHKRV